MIKNNKWFNSNERVKEIKADYLFDKKYTDLSLDEWIEYKGKKYISYSDVFGFIKD